VVRIAFVAFKLVVSKSLVVFEPSIHYSTNWVGLDDEFLRGEGLVEHNVMAVTILRCLFTYKRIQAVNNAIEPNRNGRESGQC